jgi:hypothetical protein
MFKQNLIPLFFQHSLQIARNFKYLYTFKSNFLHEISF